VRSSGSRYRRAYRSPFNHRFSSDQPKQIPPPLQRGDPPTSRAPRSRIALNRANCKCCLWAIRFWLDHERRLRYRAMFDLAIDSKLRGGDVVTVKICDLVSGGLIRSRARSSSRRRVRLFSLNASNRGAAAF